MNFLKAAFLSGLFVSQPSYAAFELSPIIATVTPTGDSATTSFTVKNSGDTKIPVQMFIVARDPDHEGKEKYQKEDPKIEELFRIHPAQLILNPGEQRSVRVTWIGNPKIKEEIPFRLLAEELPIDVEDKKVYKRAVAKVMLATNYVGSLYVRPVGVKSNLDMKAAPEPKKDGTPSNLILEAINTGTAHQILRKPKIKFISLSGAKEYDVPVEQINKIHNQNVLPGRTRRFIMPWPSTLPVGPVKVKFEIETE